MTVQRYLFAVQLYYQCVNIQLISVWCLYLHSPTVQEIVMDLHRGGSIVD